MPAAAAANVRAKLFLSMRVRGETAESVPERLEIFGKTLPPPRSVAVDAGGIRVTIGGTTVKPFSSLPSTDNGRPTVFGAQDGLLTATARGGPGDPTPIVLHATPAIHGRTLDITPSQIEMFGTRFPAGDVLS